jgi:hypothetical protein
LDLLALGDGTVLDDAGEIGALIAVSIFNRLEDENHFSPLGYLVPRLLTSLKTRPGKRRLDVMGAPCQLAAPGAWAMPSSMLRSKALAVDPGPLPASEA